MWIAPTGLMNIGRSAFWLTDKKIKIYSQIKLPKESDNIISLFKRADFFFRYVASYRHTLKALVRWQAFQMSLMPGPAVPVPEWQHKAFTILTQCRQGMALFRKSTLLVIKKQTNKKRSLICLTTYLIEILTNSDSILLSLSVNSEKHKICEFKRLHNGS